MRLAAALLLRGALGGGEEEARGERASSGLQGLELTGQRVSVDFQRAHQAVSVQPAGQLEHAAHGSPALLQGGVDRIGVAGQRSRARVGDGLEDFSQRGPAPKLQQQMERIQRLPKAKQRFVMEMIDTVLAQQDR